MLTRLSTPPRLARALDDPQPIVEPLGPLEAAVEIEADHASESGHLPLGDLVIGMRRETREDTWLTRGSR